MAGTVNTGAGGSDAGMPPHGTPRHAEVTATGYQPQPGRQRWHKR